MEVGDRLQIDLRELFGVETFYILTVLIVMLLYAFVQTHQIIYFQKGGFY